MRRLLALFASLGLGTLAIGCSGGASDPVATSGSNPASPPLSAAATLRPPADAAMFGAWELALDPATAEGSLTPVRSGAAFGDNYWINATGYLTGVPCSDCLELSGVSRDPSGAIVITVRARHPFAPGNPGLPISGKNRLDLHVFDAQLLIAGDLDPISANFGASNVTVPTRTALNANGSSGIFLSQVAAIDPSITSTAFPYVVLNPDPTAGNFAATNPNGFADLQAPTGHNVFPMGADVTADITLGLEPTDPPTRLYLFFTANYGISAATRLERLTPRYVLPEYNAKAAWQVALEIPEVTNNLEEGLPTSTAEVTVRVWDWQAGATVDPALNSLDAIRAPSAPASVIVAVPGVMSAPLDLGTAVSGTGPLDNPLVYTGLIVNSASALEGDYWAVVQVEDSRAPGLNAGLPADALSNQDGTQLDLVDVAAYRTYQIAALNVETVALRTPNTIDITPNTRQIIAQGASGAITFTATGNYSTAPLTEDLTTVATWNSTAADTGSFGGTNVFTGGGMGRTLITATYASVTSNSCEVIVKPLEFQALPVAYSSEVDAHQVTGEVYVAQNFPNKVEVYSGAGTFLRSWLVPEAHMDTVNGSRLWGMTINETANEVYVNSGWYKPNNNNVVVYTPTGTFIRGMTVQGFLIGTNQTITGLTSLDNGQLWHADFLGPGFVPFDILRHDPLNGNTIGGFSTPALGAPIGADSVGNLLYVADPGGRDVATNSALDIIDLSTQTVLASQGFSPPGCNQDDQCAVDRDGFIHLVWQGTYPSGNILVEAWEYTPPSTLAVLYNYLPADQAMNDARGIGVSRPLNNVIVSQTPYGGTTSKLAWFQ